MIKQTKILSGWPSELPSIKGRSFEFGPGLTVIFGRNGSGKTTLLRATAAHAGCPEHGGWSKFVTPLEQVRLDDPLGKIKYPDAFVAFSPGNAKAEVEWDGAPAFLHCAEQSDAKAVHFDLPHDVYDDGIRHFMADRRSPASSGMRRLSRLLAVQQKLKQHPTGMTQPTQKGVNDIWSGAEDGFIEHVKALRGSRRKHVTTVLLDEPDRSLDLATQAKFWRSGIPSFLADGHQVIVTSHSPFALFVQSACPEATVIDMELGYAEGCRSDLTAFVSGVTHG